MAKKKNKDKEKSKAKGKEKSAKKAHGLLIIGLITLGVLGLGTGAFFYFKPKANMEEEADINDMDLPGITPKTKSNSSTSSSTKTITSSNTTSSSATISNSTFPLKEGSKGALVKQLQTALIKKYGKTILPKFGADGMFGKETTAALKSKGLKTQIDLTEFTKLIA